MPGWFASEQVAGFGRNRWLTSSESAWKIKRALQLQELVALKADIDRGLADLASGRVRAFDADRLIERGRQLLTGRSRSA